MSDFIEKEKETLSVFISPLFIIRQDIKLNISQAATSKYEASVQVLEKQQI